MWIVRSSRRNAAERIALRGAMTDLGHAEHREGVWMRPANLPDDRQSDAFATAFAQAERFRANPVDDDLDLAASLWDLDGWSTRAGALLAAIAHLRREVEEGADTALAPSFLVLVAVVHHLGADPLLPPELLAAIGRGPSYGNSSRPSKWHGSDWSPTGVARFVEANDLFGGLRRPLYTGGRFSRAARTRLTEVDRAQTGRRALRREPVAVLQRCRVDGRLREPHGDRRLRRDALCDRIDRRVQFVDRHPTRFTSPTRNASSAPIRPPSSTISLATAVPTSRGQPSGAAHVGPRMPSPSSGSANWASIVAMRRSHASASCMPAPRAYPCTAAMVAYGASWIQRNVCCTRRILATT